MIDRFKAACARAWARVKAAWRKVTAFLLTLLVGIGVVSYAETRDITFEHPATRVDGTPLALEEIQETRLYCNGDLVMAVPATETSFSHDFGIGDYICHARTVDTLNQESDPSNSVTFSVTPARPDPPVIALGAPVPPQ